MSIKKVTEKDRETFNKTAGHPLQSWEWGEFRKKAGNEVVRLGEYRGNKMTNAIQIMLHKVPSAPKALLGRRPFTNFKIATLIKGPKPTREIIEELKKLGNEENLIFVKLEPNFVVSIDGQEEAQKEAERVLELLQESGATSGKTLFTPTSFWIDLNRDEDELLKSFHSKTRYNIKLAQKKGVEVVEDNSDKAFDKYIDLTRETVERQGFYAHTEKYHRLMWEILHPTGIARLLVAKYQGKVITAWIVFVWHDFLYYPYGASSEKYRNVMANNLMMWEAIRYGKRLGLKTFDLWGREPGKGFTRFKEGYNPKVVEFLGTWDLPTSPLYWPYRVAENIRWVILRAKGKFTKPSF